MSNDAIYCTPDQDPNMPLAMLVFSLKVCEIFQSFKSDTNLMDKQLKTLGNSLLENNTHVQGDTLWSI